MRKAEFVMATAHVSLSLFTEPSNSEPDQNKMWG
jgi:hypothetical protein